MRRSSSARWNDDDREVIRLLVGRGLTAQRIAAYFPGRTVKAVYTEVHERLGLHLREDWSEEEIATIRALATTHTSVEIAALLGRTPKATRTKAEEEGIRFTHGRTRT